MNYKELVKVTDAEKGDVLKFTEESFFDMVEDWDMFCNGILGHHPGVGGYAEVWKDSSFVSHWDNFAQGVVLMNKIIKSNGSARAFKEYDDFLSDGYKVG